MRSFGAPAVLPLSLRVRPHPTGASPMEAARADPAAREAVRPRLIPEGPPSGGGAGAAGTARAPGEAGVPPPRSMPPPGGGRRPPETVEEWASGVPWWGWTLAGLGVGLVVGGATYAIVQANRPISGTVVVRW